MFRLFGIQLHPAVRALFGAVALGIGLVGHFVGAVVVGSILLVWSVVGAFTRDRAGGSREHDGAPRR